METHFRLQRTSAIWHTGQFPVAKINGAIYLFAVLQGENFTGYRIQLHIKLHGSLTQTQQNLALAVQQFYKPRPEMVFITNGISMVQIMEMIRAQSL